MSISIIGVDLAKEVFQIHAADKSGKKIFSKCLNRNKFKDFWSNQPNCTVAIEACGSCHYWGRYLTKLGFTIKVIPAQFVRPFVKTNKSDSSDAEAIVTAALTPSMRFTEVKTMEQQYIQHLHRVYSRLMKQRTQLINEVRGFLREFGFVVPEGVAKFKSTVPQILETQSEDLLDGTREMIFQLMNELEIIEKEITFYNKKIEIVFKQNEAMKRLAEIPGVGVMTATSLYAGIPNVNSFKNGRGLAAYLGLVPKHRGSGGKTKILGISKRGDGYIRSLMIHGARSILSLSLKRTDPVSLKIQKLERRIGFNKTCVAIANRNARIAWVILAKGENYVVQN